MATATKTTKKSAPKATFSAEERAAMRERARELKAAAAAEEGEKDVLARIAEMPPSDRVMAEKLHALVKKVAPELTSRTWYGMPAYAKGNDLILFFKAADKFKARYANIGFTDKAMLDDGSFWASEFAITKWTSADEAKIKELVKRAVG
jgi:uncharacterized protein YdhG (YjbR/CyaY superfamily)